MNFSKSEKMVAFSQSFSPLPNLGVGIALGISSVSMMVVGFLVHRAVFRLLKRLPNRYINDIIYPYMVRKTQSLGF